MSFPLLTPISCLLQRWLPEEVAARRDTENRLSLAMAVLHCLSNAYGSVDCIGDILRLISGHTGFEAVGIRLQDGEDFPYYETIGFSEDFVLAESRLCPRDQSGALIRDGQGEVCLDCMCGNVIRGRVDPSLPFFTAGGSFWSNCTTQLLASTTEADRQARTRNRCNGEGYESVALIPLCSGDETVGLLQLNDRRRDRFTLDMIEFFEELGSSIGIALRRRRSEEALRERSAELVRANEELERRNADLDEFTHVASHDLQEPLRKLVAFSDLLERDVGHDLPDRARESLGFITDAARRMQTLVVDLLALSMAGRQAMKWTLVSVDECADRAIEALSVRIEEAGAHIARDRLPEVKGDSTAMTQLYQNLIGNALKFRSEAPPSIHLSAGRSNGSALLGVRDNGIGIDPKYRGRIFQPFKRLHGLGDYEGSGIGLAICRKAAERHGGRIWVESTPGEGAHFMFTIPCPERAGL